MTTPRYLSVASFKGWQRNEVDVDDTLIEEAINAAETSIDKALQRKMIVASASSSRSYAPDHCGRVMYVHDATAITAVVENSVTLTVGTDYQLEPLNALDAAGESVPYYRIVRHDRYWYTDGDKATVTVTGTWGWAAIPPLVVESCKIITADMLSNRDMRNGLVAITEAGGVGSRENRTVREMIQHYRHPKAYLLVA